MNGASAPATASRSAENGAHPTPGHLQERLEALEKRLEDATQKRDATQNQIKVCQDDLSKLFRDCPNRPLETLPEINQRIAKLERERTIVSIPLTQEKNILKQIHKLERAKTKVNEYQAFDDKIKVKKHQIAQLRGTLRDLNTEISSIRLELSPVRTANQLGCNVEELLGMKVSCPKDKVGQLIGKKGKNLQQLANKMNVTVDIDKQKKDDKEVVRIVGSMASLESVLSDLDRVISKTEKSIAVPSSWIQYWTAKGVTSLTEIRQCHPDVYVDVQRNSTDIKIRGIPADLQIFEQDLMSAGSSIQTKTLSVSSKEASMVVGKKGATVENIVETHQTAIDVHRDEKNPDDSTITVIGPSGHVESALREIQELLDANKEVERTVPIDAVLRATLLLDSGKGIQALFQKVNDATDKSAGFVNVNFAATATTSDVDHNNGLTGTAALVVKGKARVLDVAVEIVQAEVRRLEQMLVKIKVDPLAVPVLIGKGGQGVKALKGERSVTIEFSRDTGDIYICGLDAADVQAVADQVRELAEKHHVVRIPIDPPSLYKAQIREFLRVKAKDVNTLVHMAADDEKSQIVLRGTKENLVQATEMVNDFLAKNYSEELEVTAEDVNALLTGGKNSKIVQLSEECGVKLNSVRDRQVIVAKGEKDKVIQALKTVRSFLYGGEGIGLAKISIESEVIGMVIGKGGKTKADLEKKYSSLSILVHRGEDFITLRGPEPDVEACRMEILKLVATARITQKVSLAPEQVKKLSNAKLHLRIMQTIPVQLILEEKVPASVTIRGIKDDVRDAVAAVEEGVGKPYKIGYYIDASLFRRVKEAWRDPAIIKRIEKSSGATVTIDEAAIIFQGKRPAVKKAKEEVLKFLEFMFGSQFGRLNIEAPLMASLGKSGTVTETVAETGAQIIVDRDLCAVLIFATDSAKVQKAKDALLAKIDNEKKLMFVLQLDESEDWLVSLILGKNGSQVNILRKETGCKIDVSSQDHRITVNSNDEELVSKAKARLEEIIDKARRECVFVTIPDTHMPAFVGRSGTHITEFSEKYGVEVQVMKKGTSGVRLTGSEEAIMSAKSALIEWLASREGKVQEEQAFVSVTLRKHQISSVIGTKGSTIRSLEKEFGCKIDIDRQTSVVTVRGAKRALALEKIQKIANEDSDMKPAANTFLGTEEKDEQKNADDHSRKPQEKRHEHDQKENRHERKIATPPKPTVSMTASDFPTLSDETTQKSTKSGTAVSGPSWASILKP